MISWFRDFLFELFKVHGFQVEHPANRLAGDDIDVDGLPADVTAFVQSAVGGNHDDAFRIVVSSLLPDLVEQGRLHPTPAIKAAIDEHTLIEDRVNSTLLVTANPATAC